MPGHSSDLHCLSGDRATPTGGLANESAYHLIGAASGSLRGRRLRPLHVVMGWSR